METPQHCLPRHKLQKCYFPLLKQGKPQLVSFPCERSFEKAKLNQFCTSQPCPNRGPWFWTQVSSPVSPSVPLGPCYLLNLETPGWVHTWPLLGHGPAPWTLPAGPGGRAGLGETGWPACVLQKHTLAQALSWLPDWTPECRGSKLNTSSHRSVQGRGEAEWASWAGGGVWGASPVSAWDLLWQAMRGHLHTPAPQSHHHDSPNPPGSGTERSWALAKCLETTGRVSKGMKAGPEAGA